MQRTPHVFCEMTTDSCYEMLLLKSGNAPLLVLQSSLHFNIL